MRHNPDPSQHYSQKPGLPGHMRKPKLRSNKTTHGLHQVCLASGLYILNLTYLRDASSKEKTLGGTSVGDGSTLYPKNPADDMYFPCAPYLYMDKE